MALFRLILYVSFIVPLYIHAEASQSNVLIYGDGTQVSSEISEYQTLLAGKPIAGSVMVTHNANKKIDVNSFRLGNKPLKVELIQSVPMSSYSSIEVTIYRFQLDGMPKGIHTLQPIKVNVGGKDYQAPPLTIEVAG